MRKICLQYMHLYKRASQMRYSAVSHTLQEENVSSGALGFASHPRACTSGQCDQELNKI